jgi:hypothetical protein
MSRQSAKAGWFQRLAFAGIAIAARIPGMRGVLNRFDAAFQGWGERSWLFQSLQDAWLEIDAMTRMELQRVHEALIENSTIVQKIRSLKIQFSVGPAGLKVIPESSDDAFNDARSVTWERWWARPELGSETSGAQLTRVWAGMLFDKGEIFIYKTSADVKAGKRVRKEPRLQTIDAHRVRTPSGLTADTKTGFPIIDGIVVNPATGERVAYFVKRSDFTTFMAGTSNVTEEKFDRLEAANMIHKFCVLRPGQMRGIPKGASAFNLVRDNMDLHKMEMQAAKLACEIATVETNPSGELSTFSNRRQLLNIQTQNRSGAAGSKPSALNYEVSFGAKKIAMPSGTDIKNFMIDRPTVVQQQYWDLHYTLICMGYDVPKLLVMPYSLQGTVTRADLDVCANAFRADFELIREILENIYEWQCQWDLDYNLDFTAEKHAKNPRSAHCAVRHEVLARVEKSHWVQDLKTPDDACVCLIRPPRAPNVDIGYTAKALEIEMRLGVKPPQDVYADKNQDWRQQMRQMAEFVQYVNQLGTEFGVEPSQLTSLITPPADEQPDDPENGPGKESAPENRRTAAVHA